MKKFLTMILFAAIFILGNLIAANADDLEITIALDGREVVVPNYSRADLYAKKYSAWIDNCKKFAENVLKDEGRELVGSIWGNNHQPYELDNPNHYDVCYVIPGESLEDFAARIRNMFLSGNVKVGDIAQMYWNYAGLYKHTAIIAKVEADKVYFLQAGYHAGKDENGNTIYEIRYMDFTYDRLAELYQNAGSSGGISLYHFDGAPAIWTSGDINDLTKIATILNITEKFLLTVKELKQQVYHGMIYPEHIRPV